MADKKVTENEAGPTTETAAEPAAQVTDTVAAANVGAGEALKQILAYYDESQLNDIHALIDAFISQADEEQKEKASLEQSRVESIAVLKAKNALGAGDEDKLAKGTKSQWKPVVEALALKTDLADDIDQIAQLDDAKAQTSAIDKLKQDGRISDGDEKILKGGDGAKIKALADDLRSVGEASATFDEVMDRIETFEAYHSINIIKQINLWINQIDLTLKGMLNQVMHNGKFQALEASWRGLEYLVMGVETGERLKLRLLNASKDDLRSDLENAVEFDQSALFKKIYEEEYGTFGGNPYSVLIGDYSFGSKAPDVELLRKIAQVAAASHAPFIAAAHPELFDMKSFKDLAKPRSLSKIFESTSFVKWRSLREEEDSRYVALVMPRVLLRAPYHPVDNPADGLNFKESEVGLDTETSDLEMGHDSYLWGNPAYVLAQRIANAFSLYSWTAAIRGAEGGGKVENLPVHLFRTDEGEMAIKCPTEVVITDRREKELSDLGFIALVHCKNTDYAAFFGGQTLNKPITYNTAAANANARLSARLPYMLNASRFAHYIKVNMRDKVGSFMSQDDVQTYLNTWIIDYVLDKDDAGHSIKAKYPLREARVDVREVPGEPGSYEATVFLRPHFQLEDLTASLRLVAQLPAAAA